MHIIIQAMAALAKLPQVKVIKNLGQHSPVLEINMLEIKLQNLVIFTEDYVLQLWIFSQDFNCNSLPRWKWVKFRKKSGPVWVALEMHQKVKKPRVTSSMISYLKWNWSQGVVIYKNKCRQNCKKAAIQNLSYPI